MKKMLLHSCCGPCSTQVIDVLKNDYDITILYYNPNIQPEEEYAHRLAEQKRFCKAVGIPVIDLDYDTDEFLCSVKGHEKDREGGERCKLCFALRLDKTAALAKEKGFDIFATTLSVSPHKNTAVINEVGEEVSKKYNIEFLAGNFKKQDGYKKSIEFAKQYNLYRQNYCGCLFSKVEREIFSEKRKNFDSKS